MSGSVEHLAQRRAAFVAEGLCAACGADAEGYRFCATHRAYHRRYQRERRRRLIQRGICMRCADQPPRPGRTLCAACNDIERGRSRERARRRHADALADGTCTQCFTEDARPGMRTCGTCRKGDS